MLELYCIDNIYNNWPAVWCLFSIAVILVIFIPEIRKRFYVKKWYAWKYLFKRK